MPRSHMSTSSNHRDRATAREDLFIMECEASYLRVLPSTNTPIDSRKQLKKVLQQAGRNPSEKQVKEIWSRNETNVLTYKEYCNVLRKINVPSRDDLLNSFKMMDLNNDGFVSHKELWSILTSHGEKMTELEVKKIISEADVNKDGKLDYREFCTLMLSTSQRCQQNNFKQLQILKAERKSDDTGRISESTPRHCTGRLSQPMPFGDVSNHEYEHASLKKGLKPPSRSTSAKRSLISENLENTVKIKQSGISGKKSTIEFPKSLKTWNHTRSKGCFYLDNDDGSVSCHHFLLQLPTSSQVWLTIKPYLLSQNQDMTLKPVDTYMLILRQSSSEPKSTELVGITNLNENSLFCWKGDLRSGSHVLVPFTSGCRLFRRRKEPEEEIQLIRKDQNNEIQLSRAFRETLSDMFEMCDLDGNGLLNRQEFSCFQLLTSDEEVDDEAWQIVQENFEMKKGELTREGFIELHLMQAREENVDASEELMDTLLCMGYNKALDLDQACPFEVDVYSANCEVEISMLTLSPGHQHKETQRMINESIIQFGERRILNGLHDIELYVYKDNARVSSALQNNSKSTVEINIDCTEMKNCTMTKRKQTYTLRLVANSNMLVDHVMAEDKKTRLDISLCVL